MDDNLGRINEQLASIDRCVLDEATIQRLTKQVNDQDISQFIKHNARLAHWQNVHPRDNIATYVRQALARCRLQMYIQMLLERYLSDKRTYIVPTSDFHRQTPWSDFSDRNNCYAYAIDDFSILKRDKSAPGDRARPVDLNSCADMITRLRQTLHDRRIQAIKCNPQDVNPLHPRRYMMRMDIAQNTDFHFYRENKHRLVRVEWKDGMTWQNVLHTLASKYDIPVVFLECVNKDIIKCQQLNKQSSVLVCVPMCLMMYQKNGYAPYGPRNYDACGKRMEVGTPLCQNYGQGLNYKLPCGYYTLDRQPMRIFSKPSE